MLIVRERKLREKFNDLAERLRNAQLTVDQLSELQSIKYFYRNNHEESCVKLRAAFPMVLLLPLIALLVVGLSLSPLSHIAAVFLDICDFQVMHCTQ